MAGGAFCIHFLLMPDSETSYEQVPKQVCGVLFVSLGRPYGSVQLVSGNFFVQVEMSNEENRMNSRPNIVMSSLDAERIEALLDSLPIGAFPGKTELESELARAEIVEPEDIPPTVITMNSTVKFQVESSPEAFTLTLVYPKDMDSSSNKISILAPVGSALIGLSVGDAIEWPKPGGGVLRVRVEDIVYQPEQAGEYHR